MATLILGDARHGKDTVAEKLAKMEGLEFTSSSMFAAGHFLFDALKGKYGYKTVEDCFEDRVNHRKEWHDLIALFNSEDPTRMAVELLKENDLYVGMRSDIEFAACMEAKLFDHVIWVDSYPRVDFESGDSMKIDYHLALGLCTEHKVAMSYVNNSGAPGEERLEQVVAP